MSPAAKRPRRPQNTVPESLPQQNDIPPESTTTVILKTVMELKGDVSGIRRDLDHLKAKVEVIEKEQKTASTINKRLAAACTILSALLGILMYAVANWGNIRLLIKSLVD